MTRPEAHQSDPQRAATCRSWTEWVAWVATEDHCEWANCYVAWLKTPLGVLSLGAVSSLLCGLFVTPQGFVLLAVIATVIAVGLVWPLVAIRGVRCRMVFDARRGREGHPSSAKLIVTNRWPWPVWGLAMTDPLGPAQVGAAIALARLGGWTSATFNISLTPALRGVYPREEVRMGTGFPFGLYRASRTADVPRRLVVWPRTFWLPSLGSMAARRHWRGPLSDRLTGNNGTRLGARDHRDGDSLRDVHWAKSARYDRLIVSEREAAMIEEVGVVVDDSSPPPDGPTTDEALEWRLRIAASICECFANGHGRVDLWLGKVKLTAGHTPGDLPRLLDEIASYRPGEVPERIGRADVSPTGPVIAIEGNACSIVLRTAAWTPSASRSAGKLPVWIEVDPNGDVPGQVLRGWRPGKRRASRVG